MRYLCNDPNVPGWEHLRVHYANTPLPEPLPHDSGLVMLNVEEKAKAPNGSMVNVHWATRPDGPTFLRPWAVGIIKARAAAAGIQACDMYSTPTCASYYQNQTPQKRNDVVAYMVETAAMLSSSALFPTCYDAHADADGIPTPQEIGNEVSRVRSAMLWACAVREVTNLPVYAVVHEREKDTTNAPGRWLYAEEYWPVLEEIKKHSPDGIVHWTNTAFVNWAWTASETKRLGYRDWYRKSVACVPAVAIDDATWNGEIGKHIQTMLHGLAGTKAVLFRQAIKSIFGASSAPSNEGGNQ